jgi:hypothetical protein
MERRAELNDMKETFPDIGSLSDQELKDPIAKLAEEERQASHTRRLLHGRIDILRAEPVHRLKTKREEGDALISGDHGQKLAGILAGKAPDASEAA